MAVVEALPDRSYSWRCEDCPFEAVSPPHRGPRRSLCRRCKNLRYLASRSPSQVEFERIESSRRNREYRARLREQESLQAW